MVERSVHRRWLLGEAERLIALFQRRALIPAGGFFNLDDEGRALKDAGPTGLGASSMRPPAWSIALPLLTSWAYLARID